MNKKALKYLMIIFAAATQFLPVFALAGNAPPQITFDRTTFGAFLDNLKTWVAQAIFILGILMILYAAFLYMTSAGDDTKIEKAKKTFIYGIVGIIIAMLAYGIWDAVYSFLQGG